MKKVIVVESPTKAKKIASFLTKDFLVKASLGHIRDLPEREMGIDFQKLLSQNDSSKLPLKFVIISGKEKTVREIANLCKEAMVYCASDPDREGEAIAMFRLSGALNSL